MPEIQNAPLEGIVLGHATCQLDVYGDLRDCGGAVERVINPYKQDVDGVEEEIDVCARHLQGLYDDI